MRNWIPFTPDQDVDVAAQRLVDALDTDLSHAHAHTRWLVKALDWDEHKRDASFLLRGSELADAEAWLASVSNAADPAPTSLQREYLYASRRASSRRQRFLVVASLAAVVIAVALAVFALISRSQAVSATAVSESRRLASESGVQLAVDPERSILLGMEAIKTAVTPEATYALQQALDTSPLQVRLASVGLQPYNGFWGPAVSYSPNGRLLAEGSEGGFVTIFETATGHVIKRIQIGAQAPVVAFNPAGTLLAVGTNQDVRIVDPSTGVIRQVAKTGDLAWGPFSWSADGRTVYFADLESIVRWDLATNQLRILNSGGVRGVGAVPNSWAQALLSRDGRRLYVAGNPGVAIIDPASGRPIATNTIGGANTWWIALSPDGNTLAVAVSPTWPSFSMSGEIVLLNAHTLKLERTLAQVKGVAFQTLAFSPDGRELAYGGSDGSAGIFDVASGEQLVSLPGHTTDIYEVAFSPDGRHVVTAAGDGRALIWRANSGELLAIPTDGFSTLYNGWQNVDLSFQTGQVDMRGVPISGPYTNKQVTETFSSVTGKRLSPPLVVGPTSNFVRLSLDGRSALSGPQTFNATEVHRLQIWDVAKGRIIDSFNPKGVANFPTLSPDGSRLVYQSSTPPDYAQTLDLATGRTQQLGQYLCGGGYTYFGVSPDNKRVAGNGICGLLYVWDAATGRTIGTFHFVGDLNLGPLAFSRSGSLLAVANSGNLGQVTILDIDHHRTVTVVTGGSREIQQVAFSPDGSMFATASLDGTTRLFDPYTGAPLRQFDQPGPVNNVTFSPDGQYIATLDFHGVIRIWPACDGCTNVKALMQQARRRITRQLTATERSEFIK